MLLDESYIAPYRVLNRMRQELVELKQLDDYGLFARSMVSSRDAFLMRRAARKTSSTDIAGRIFLEIFTMGGVGSLTPDMSPWLRREEDDSDLLVQVGIVLAALVRDLADGTAMRALFEFHYHDDIRRKLERINEDVTDDRIAAILRMSLVEQVEDRIESWGENPGARALWMLRTYVDMPLVRDYLHRFIALGSVSALASVFFADEIIEWTSFDKLVYNAPYQRRIVINLAIDNVARGATVDDLRRSLYFQSISAEARSELLKALQER